MIEDEREQLRTEGVRELLTRRAAERRTQGMPEEDADRWDVVERAIMDVASAMGDITGIDVAEAAARLIDGKAIEDLNCSANPKKGDVKNVELFLSTYTNPTNGNTEPYGHIIFLGHDNRQQSFVLVSPGVPITPQQGPRLIMLDSDQKEPVASIFSPASARRIADTLAPLVAELYPETPDAS